MEREKSSSFTQNFPLGIEKSTHSARRVSKIEQKYHYITELPPKERVKECIGLARTEIKGYEARLKTSMRNAIALDILIDIVNIPLYLAPRYYLAYQAIAAVYEHGVGISGNFAHSCKMREITWLLREAYKAKYQLSQHPDEIEKNQKMTQVLNMAYHIYGGKHDKDSEDLLTLSQKKEVSRMRLERLVHGAAALLPKFALTQFLDYMVCLPPYPPELLYGTARIMELNAIINAHNKVLNSEDFAQENIELINTQISTKEITRNVRALCEKFPKAGHYIFRKYIWLMGEHKKFSKSEEISQGFVKFFKEKWSWMKNTAVNASEILSKSLTTLYPTGRIVKEFGAI